MKNETKENFGNTTPFTILALETLKKKGFKYVQIKSFTADKRPDYMEPRYLVLIPLMEFPAEGEVEIYESIDSKLLLDLAVHPGDGMDVFLSYSRKV